MPSTKKLRENIAYEVRGTFRAFENALITYLAESKVPVAYFHILRLPWTADGIAQTAISTLAFMTPSVTSQLIQKMGKEVLLIRESSSEDSRKKQVFLTKTGWKLREKILKGALDIPIVAAESLTDKEIEIMLKALNTMRETLENS